MRAYGAERWPRVYDLVDYFRLAGRIRGRARVAARRAVVAGLDEYARFKPFQWSELCCPSCDGHFAGDLVPPDECPGLPQYISPPYPKMWGDDVEHIEHDGPLRAPLIDLARVA